MTVAGNIGYALKVEGLPKAERDARIAEVASVIGLEDYLERKPGQLSGGQRQRVAMGRAMIREPKVFLFDEPLSNLDAKLRVAMRLEIRRLHQRLRATSIFVTHDQVEAMTLADRLVVMNAGRIDQIGTPTEVYDTPASTYVAGFIGAPPMNLMPGRVTADGLSVEIADGQRLQVSPELAAVRAGQPVTVGVRPEHASLAGRDGDNALTARFEFFEELGMGRLFHGRVGAREFIVHSAEKTPPAFGEDIAVYVPTRQLHLFDAETGLRLEARPDLARAAA